MNTSAMTFQHQSAPWEWPLARASATRIAPEKAPRWLLVTAGQVWLTRTGGGLAGGDIWLGAGERHALPAGSEWVVEAWPEGRVALLEAPRQPAGGRVGRWVFAPVLRPA
jgi:hypothetical protein